MMGTSDWRRRCWCDTRLRRRWELLQAGYGKPSDWAEVLDDVCNWAGSSKYNFLRLRERVILWKPKGRRRIIEHWCGVRIHCWAWGSCLGREEKGKKGMDWKEWTLYAPCKARLYTQPNGALSRNHNRLLGSSHWAIFQRERTQPPTLKQQIRSHALPQRSSPYTSYPPFQSQLKRTRTLINGSQNSS